MGGRALSSSILFLGPVYLVSKEAYASPPLPSGLSHSHAPPLRSFPCLQVWMTANVTDGEGELYATGRALFISPKGPIHTSWVGRLLPGWLGGQGRGGSSHAEH